MKKIFVTALSVCILAFAIVSLASCGDINTNNDGHFDENGYLIKDSLDSSFIMKHPSKLKFFVEVSGSMNGFFRANKPTEFKADLWHVLSYYSSIVPNVCILTNDGNQGANISLKTFQNKMNTGAFISTASTKVPVMLNTIISNIDADAGEVGVLVSDMKYSPVDAAAPDVLMTQYSTDVARILGSYGKSISLICATSNFLDNTGSVVCDRSPYYFFIIGNQERVAEIRNGISTLIQNRDHFVDNIDSGFDFGSPRYSFGISNKCEQLDDEPTFTGYEECDEVDTCTVKLKVNLEDYRWITTVNRVFRDAFKVSAKYGSGCKVGDIKIDVQNINGDNKQLKRTAIATVDLKVFNMATDSEVLEWSLELPNTDYTLFNEFFEGAYNENDPSKSFSVIDFVKGMFYGSVINKKMKSNYILISKES